MQTQTEKSRIAELEAEIAKVRKLSSAQLAIANTKNKELTKEIERLKSTSSLPDPVAPQVQANQVIGKLFNALKRGSVIMQMQSSIIEDQDMT